MSGLVYILPKYETTTNKHYHYEYKLLEGLSEEMDLRVVIEKGEDMDIDGTYVQRFSFPPLRALELLVVLLWFRLRGYADTYTHYSYYGGMITGVLSTLLGGTSYYWNCEEVERVTPRDTSYWQLWGQLRGRLPFYLSLYLTDVLVTGTEMMKQYYVETYGLGPENVRTLPNWVDSERFAALPEKRAAREELGLSPDGRVVLYLHKIGKKKGADHILDIAERLDDEPEPVEFVVVGDGYYREELEAELAAAGLDDVVRFVGSVPNDEAIVYFRAADVYVLPSRAEGFPRVLLEAMAARCPFVSTDVGGVEEIVPEGTAEYVVEYGDWDTFTERVESLLHGDGEREHVEDRLWDHVQQYDREAVVGRFREVVGGSRT